MSDNDFTQLKHEIAKAYPGFEQNATSAWASIVEELGRVTVDIAKLGPDYIPIIDFSNLRNISPDQLEELKRKGSFVFRNVVPQSEAQAWRQGLLDFVNANPNAEGTPAENPQYFQIFYTKPQVQARAHPNVLATQTWCNSLYSSSSTTETVDLDAPLTYVDRFRMRQPGFAWSAHPPHMDGGSIERWLDPTFRSCFESILKGNWREYNPYSLKGRIGARTSSKGLPNQASIFRTFQGWMAISETAPNQGTLQVFPDVLLSTSYIMLRPFFTPTLSPSEDGYLNAENWKFDLTSPIFHGVSQSSTAGAAGAARPFGFSPETHPHLDLDKTMVSVPPVRPGDMVFWHCDVVHAVESEHTGAADSSVMYIPAVPKCTQNDQYVDKQLAHFLKGYPPPDFPQGRTELDYNLHATDEDLTSPQARKAMGLA